MDSGRLSVKEVCKSYPRGQEWIDVLANVSLSVEPGEVVAVTGGRHDGKTTLLSIAAGMGRPDKGQVSLGGVNLVDCPDDERSRILGQQLVWIDRDGPGVNVEVTKFVGFPLALHGHGRRRVEREAGQILARVGATKCMGRRWGELSHWQRVLVGFARAFADSPQIVVIDDLLDALGGPGTEEASDLLRSLVEQSEPRCGVLMSVSDMDSAIYADKVWSITGKQSLRLMAARQGGGRIIPFPHRDGTRSGGSIGVGSS